MRKVAVLAGLLVLVIVSLTGMAWTATQADSALRRLQTVLREETGRTLSAAGGAHISVWPRPEIVLRDAAVSGPGGLPVLAAKEMRFAIGWLGLVIPSPEITEIALIEPHFNLLIDRDGRTSWASDKPAVLTTPVRIEDGTAAFLDERSGRAVEVGAIAAMLAAPDAGSLSLRGSGVWNRQRFELDAYVKSLERLTRDGSPAEIAFRSPILDMTFGGRMSLARDLALAGRVTAGVPDLRRLLRWTGSDVADGPGLKLVSLEGGLDAGKAKISVGDAKLSVDGMQAAGQVGLDWTGERPAIGGTIATQRIDLDVYWPEAAKPGAPIDFTGLHGLVAAVDVAAAAVVHRGAALGSGRAHLTIKDGVLDAALSDLSLFGGRGSGRILADGAGRQPALRVEFAGSGLDMAPFAQRFMPFAIVEGKSGVSLSLGASGTAPEEMLATLAGAARFDLQGGAFSRFDAAGTIAQLSSRVLDGWTAGGAAKTPFDSLSAAFDIKDGIASIANASFGASALRATAAGEIDLLRRALDVKIDPEIAAPDGAFARFPVAISVKGPWARPKIYPDMPGILEDPAAAFAALRQLGLPVKVTEGN